MFKQLVIGILLTLSLRSQIQEVYQRTLINMPAIEAGSFGNFVGPVDLDGDGKMEIYAVNNNLNDTGPGELIPRIYKFEKNISGGWDSVWTATANIPAQNTWPTLSITDFDGDGRKEITWGIVNNITTDLNPDRILVFESVPGQEYLGKPVTGNYLPNVKFKITATNSFNVRPIKSIATDFNKDGKSELVFCDRASGTAGTGKYMFGVISTATIPNGDTATGGGVWNINASGLSNTWKAGTAYDVAVLDSTIYLFQDGAINYVTAITYDKGTFAIRALDSSKVPGGSWKSAQVVDIDGNGQKEIVIAGYGATAGQNKVFLLQRLTDSTLSSTMIADMAGIAGAAGRLYGGGNGDIGNDGKVDFVFGTRGSTPPAAILRLSYMGGTISSPASYTISVIDRNLMPAGNGLRIDAFTLANVDGVAGDEIFYCATSYEARSPIVVLNNGKKGIYVTLTANTATVPDTIKSNSTVQIRGGSVMLTWDNNSAQMSNTGGDYWKFTGLFPAGESFPYKFYADAKPVITNSDFYGWESDLSGGSRFLTVGNNDTIIELQFVNGSAIAHDQFWRPYIESDSLEITFRVNMANVIDFDSLQMKVGVRGSFPLSWTQSVYLTREQNDFQFPNRYPGRNFWSGTIKYPVIAPVTDNTPRHVEYKFVIASMNALPTDSPLGWEDSIKSDPDVLGNRFFDIKNGSSDTTLHWKWWENDITNNLFNIIPTNEWISIWSDSAFINSTPVSIGAKIEVIDPQGIKCGQFTVAQQGEYGLMNVYRDDPTTPQDEGARVDDQLRFLINGKFAHIQNFKEVFWTSMGDVKKINLRYNDVVPTNEWVSFWGDSIYFNGSQLKVGDVVDAYDPQGTHCGTFTVTIAGTFGLMPVYRDDPSTTTIDEGATPGDTILIEINGTKVAIHNGVNTIWTTNGDIKQVQITATPLPVELLSFEAEQHNSLVLLKWKTATEINNYGFEIERKYSVSNESTEQWEKIGFISGAGTSNTPMEYSFIDKVFKKNEISYRLKQLDRNGVFVYTNSITVKIMPATFSLNQNFPNPFNPTTTIRYAIPITSRVKLTIFNTLGQSIEELVNTEQTAGWYEIVWNVKISSGLYFYRLEATGTGNSNTHFLLAKKMLLLK